MHNGLLQPMRELDRDGRCAETKEQYKSIRSGVTAFQSMRTSEECKEEESGGDSAVKEKRNKQATGE